MFPDWPLLAEVPRLVVNLRQLRQGASSPGTSDVVSFMGATVRLAPQLVYATAALAVHAGEDIAMMRLTQTMRALGYKPRKKDDLPDRSLLLHRLREGFEAQLTGKVSPLPDVYQLLEPIGSDRVRLNLHPDQVDVIEFHKSSSRR
jgi:hypothetical protein